MIVKDAYWKKIMEEREQMLKALQAADEFHKAYTKWNEAFQADGKEDYWGEMEELKALVDTLDQSDTNYRAIRGDK